MANMEVVARKHAKLIIEESKLCKAERRTDMQYLLEQMTELERQVQVGKEAERSLKILEEEWLKLCEMEIEEED